MKRPRLKRTVTTYTVVSWEVVWETSEGQPDAAAPTAELPAALPPALPPDPAALEAPDRPEGEDPA
jgi:hypothetical protein